MIYVTCPTAALARAIANDLLERRLIACANLVTSQSIYRWEGKLHDNPETLLIMKSRAALADQAMTAVRGLHPDQTPCIVAYESLAVDAGYAAWIDAETTANR